MPESMLGFMLGLMVGMVLGINKKTVRDVRSFAKKAQKYS